MSKQGRPFKDTDLSNLTVVDEKHLYWKNKKVRTGGLDTSNIISIIAIIVAALVALFIDFANFDKNWMSLKNKTISVTCEFHQFNYCQSYRPKDATKPKK